MKNDEHELVLTFEEWVQIAIGTVVVGGRSQLCDIYVVHG